MQVVSFALYASHIHPPCSAVILLYMRNSHWLFKCYKLLNVEYVDVALECAGFLSGLGFHTGLMIRSSPLKSFDQV